MSGIPGGFGGAPGLGALVPAIRALGVSTAAAETTVVSANADTVLLAANANRKGFAVRNDATTVLYLQRGGAASAASFIQVQPGGGYYFDEFPNWTGAVNGFWAGAPVGNAVIREAT